MKSGPRNSIPNVVVTVPAMMRYALGLVRSANARQPNPTSTMSPPAPAKRCAGLGGAGRPESAVTIDDRDAERAGHHAAAAAVRIARAIAAAIAHHGRWNMSMRCLASLSMFGA